MKLDLNKLSNLISHELVREAGYDIRIVSVSYSHKALRKKGSCRQWDPYWEQKFAKENVTAMLVYSVVRKIS